MATILDSDTVAGLRRRLLEFFDDRARDLPWRATDDPYAIWVSEIMLQQTRVDTVIPYFERWLERFPDVESLAAAEEDEVFRLWEGLGYYRRARFLHAAARRLVDRHDGLLPRTTEALRELPGIGVYTAGAIASIAFGRPVPAVDGNVRRVLARLFDEPSPTASELESWAGSLVDRDRPGDFNQALMELGATVCTPRSPRCEVCPLGSLCRARERGTVDERPAPTKRKAVPSVEYGVAVLVREGEGGWRAGLVRRPDDGMLAGLREFPAVEKGDGEAAEPAAARAAEGVGVAVDEGTGLDPVRHVYSHLKATYHPVVFRVAESGSGELEWMSRESLEHEALPRAQRRIADELAATLERRATPP